MNRLPDQVTGGSSFGLRSSVPGPEVRASCLTMRMSRGQSGHCPQLTGSSPGTGIQQGSTGREAWSQDRSVPRAEYVAT
jgi:hypothetical protein